ncbi:hypothetical protein DICVIV_04493 [Dictyocaulus viviparus]|uniref:Uncharacterized protein n=1 Tax=Dictyocaulus viviparus TaxID=29172 RepID=A0A0D8XXH5_DICVI|nr:hypothetical protein DICVIV_04493 [Dictyocaulus viviparus]
MSRRFLNLTSHEVLLQCGGFMSPTERRRMIEHDVNGFLLYNFGTFEFLRTTVGLSRSTTLRVLQTFRNELPDDVFLFHDGSNYARNLFVANADDLEMVTGGTGGGGDAVYTEEHYFN